MRVKSLDYVQQELLFDVVLIRCFQTGFSDKLSRFD